MKENLIILKITIILALIVAGGALIPGTEILTRWIVLPVPAQSNAEPKWEKYIRLATNGKLWAIETRELNDTNWIRSVRTVGSLEEARGIARDVIQVWHRNWAEKHNKSKSEWTSMPIWFEPTNYVFSAEAERLRSPPHGWGIESDGVRYRYVFPGGHGACFTEPTVEAAIAAAWRQMEYQSAVATSKWHRLKP